jgi:hypothetical protein
MNRQADRRAEGIRRSNLKQPQLLFGGSWTEMERSQLLRTGGRGAAWTRPTPQPPAGPRCRRVWSYEPRRREWLCERPRGVGRQLGQRPVCKLKVRIYLLEGIKTSSIDNRTTRPSLISGTPQMNVQNYVFLLIF